MTTSLQSALQLGDDLALYQALKGKDHAWAQGGALPKGSLPWLLLEEAERGQHDAAIWTQLWGAVKAAGLPLNLTIEVSEAVWRGRHTQRIPKHMLHRRYAQGLRTAAADAVPMLERLIYLNATPAIEGLLAQGISPYDRDAQGHAAWVSVGARTDPSVVAVLNQGSGTMDWSPTHLHWLVHGGVAHPQATPWAQLPSEWSHDIQTALRQVSYSSEVGEWLDQRPQDWAAWREALNPNSLWPLIARGLTTEQSWTLRALDDPALRDPHLWPLYRRAPYEDLLLGEASEATVSPAAWWLEYAERPDADSPEGAEQARRWDQQLSELMDRFVLEGPDPTSPWSLSWGELLARRETHYAHRHEASLFEQWTGPEYDALAPHPQTGRTALWWVDSPEGADRWIGRGCALTHEDAHGDQAFAAILARAVRTSQAALSKWVIQQFKAGAAPVSGKAFGRSLAEWVEGRQDVKAAWVKACTRQGFATPEMEQSLLHVPVQKLQPERVRQLVRQGAAVDARNGEGQTPLMQVFQAETSTHVRRQQQIKMAQFLVAHGASLVFPDGTTLVDQALSLAEHQIKENGGGVRVRKGLFGWCVQAQLATDLPWSDAQVFATVEHLAATGQLEETLSEHMSQSVAADWLQRLMSAPSDMPLTPKTIEAFTHGVAQYPQLWLAAAGGFPLVAPTREWAEALGASPDSEERTHWCSAVAEFEQDPAVLAWRQALQLLHQMGESPVVSSRRPRL